MTYPRQWGSAEQIPGTDLSDALYNPAYTYGESISAGHALYLNISDGKVYKTDADILESIKNFVGFAIEAGVLNDTKRVLGPGKVVTGLSGLTVGAPVYLSNTAGGIGTSAGTYPYVIGIALSTTSLLIMPSNHKQLTIHVEQFLAEGTSGEALAIGDLIYLKASDGKLYKADADADESTYSFVGVTQSAAGGADETVQYTRPGGIAKGLSGLTAGSYQYLSATAGALSTTPHATRPLKVGQALSATTMRVIEPKFWRTGTVTFDNTGDFVVTTGFLPTNVSLIGPASASIPSSVSIGGNKCFQANATAGYVKAAAVWTDEGTDLQGTITAYSETGFTINITSYPGATRAFTWIVEGL